MTNEDINTLREQNMFGLGDTITIDELWEDTELVKSEIVNNLANTVTHYIVDINNYSKNNELLSYIADNTADKILEGIDITSERYMQRLEDMYVDNMMTLAEDIYEARLK